MKYCKKCGEIIESGDSYCIFCGTPVSKIGNPGNPPVPIMPGEKSQGVITWKNKNNLIIIGAVSVVVLLLVVFLLTRPSLIGTWEGSYYYGDYEMTATLTIEFEKDNTGYMTATLYGDSETLYFSYEKENECIWLTYYEDGTEKTEPMYYELNGKTLSIWDDEGSWTLYKQ